MNVVVAGSGELIEIQGTAEGQTFARSQLDEMLDLAMAGTASIMAVQRELLATAPTPRSSSIRLVVATANPHKVSEIAAILGDLVELVPRPSGVGEVVEDGDTLEANARLKAAAICAATGEPAVADDTGLEVDALDGAPGVHSARFAGDAGDAAANMAKLLTALVDQDPRRRRARFRTVALVRFPDGDEIVAEGVVEGWITTEPRGAIGFGYDPVFVPAEGDGRTFAELDPTEKNAISHRGRAFRSLAERLPAAEAR